VIVTEAVTGGLPFRGQSGSALAHAILREEPILGDLQEPLAGVLRTCLAKNRDDRYSTVDALRRALLPALDGVPLCARLERGDRKDEPTSSVSSRASRGGSSGRGSRDPSSSGR
jgi:serine/threonine protein kinase